MCVCVCVCMFECIFVRVCVYLCVLILNINELSLNTTPYQARANDVTKINAASAVFSQNRIVMLHKLAFFSLGWRIAQSSITLSYLKASSTVDVKNWNILTLRKNHETISLITLLRQNLRTRMRFRLWRAFSVKTPLQRWLHFQLLHPVWSLA